MLADGSATRLDVYMASVVWHGQLRGVLVTETAGASLVGMSLLQGSRLTIEVVADGAVEIRKIPPTAISAL